MFQLGAIVTTQGIACLIEKQTLVEKELKQLLIRHKSGDWGDLCKSDKDTNDRALQLGERLVSAYTVNKIKIWIITEADRKVTTILLPDEY